jgi:hypothetical protein
MPPENLTTAERELTPEAHKRCMEIFERLLKTGELSADAVLSPTVTDLFVLIDAGWQARAATVAPSSTYREGKLDSVPPAPVAPGTNAATVAPIAPASEADLCDCGLRWGAAEVHSAKCASRVPLPSSAATVAPHAAIGDFLRELYATMVEPCAEGQMTVAEITAALLTAARQQREQLAAATVARPPREPTWEMICAGYRAIETSYDEDDEPSDDEGNYYATIWKAMLDAAPVAVLPVQPEPDVRNLSPGKLLMCSDCGEVWPRGYTERHATTCPLDTK